MTNASVNNSDGAICLKEESGVSLTGLLRFVRASVPVTVPPSDSAVKQTLIFFINGIHWSKV
jgi:hypothetical protein